MNVLDQLAQFDDLEDNLFSDDFHPVVEHTAIEDDYFDMVEGVFRDELDVNEWM